MSNVGDPSTAYISQYDSAFQISPIYLVGGIAVQYPGGLMPITNLYGQRASTDNLGGVFARYVPLPSSTLISNAVGSYPFANQQVAANAIIEQPLTVSMLMIAPVNTPGGYATKQSYFLSLQKALWLHNTSGGLFHVATPAYLYQNMIMTGMTDITHTDGGQMQIEWQLDFVQPLVTLAAATAAQNTLMSKITNGTKLTKTTYTGQ